MKIKHKCETIKGNRLCGNVAIALVKPKWNKEDSFYVCKKCLPAYEYVQLKEYGNTESNFIVELLGGENE